MYKTYALSQNSVGTKLQLSNRTESIETYINPMGSPAVLRIVCTLILFSEFILGEQQDEIKINETTINNIRYADDIVLIANNVQELQNLINFVVYCTVRFTIQRI